jgi:chorismate-pyruvate lyase
MNFPLGSVVPRLETLFALFPPAEDMPPSYEQVPGSAMPQPYRDLLVHDQHMTVTVEEFHGGPVDVRILDRRHDGATYARKILLVLQSSGRVVQFGIVHMDLNQCSNPVRRAIVAGDTPLGRVLINHNVLRTIEPTSYLKINPGPQQLAWFGMKTATPLFGRLALIHCDGRPAVELLEVVAPEPD